ncbi:MAG: hypothetical protein RL326_238 [Pseudomonadota bacterium]|jgi:hypothetical protein
MIERHYTGFSTKHAIATTACGILFILCVSGCKDSQKSSVATISGAASATPLSTQDKFSLDSILTTLEGAGSGVHEAMRPHTDAVQAKTKEELDKLFRWEYKVVEVPITTDTAALQAQLSALGEENWEVVDMSVYGQLNRITCKRRPSSAIGYLKYIPGF